MRLGCFGKVGHMRAFANSTAQRDEGIGARPRGRSTWVRTGAVVPLLLVAACGPGKSVYVYRSDATVAEAARTMAERRIHRVLVLDEKKKLLGVVAALDVCRHVTS